MSYYDVLAQIESGGNPYASAGTSSASGLYQFTRGTWEGLGYNWSDVFNTNLQNEAVQRLTAQNTNYLQSHGVSNPTYADLYAAHFLGAGGAAGVLTADPNAPIGAYVNQSQINANPNVFKNVNTVGDFWGWLKKKTGQAVSALGGENSGITESGVLGDGTNWSYSPTGGVGGIPQLTIGGGGAASNGFDPVGNAPTWGQVQAFAGQGAATGIVQGTVNVEAGKSIPDAVGVGIETGLSGSIDYLWQKYLGPFFGMLGGWAQIAGIFVIGAIILIIGLWMLGRSNSGGVPSAA